MRTLTPLIILSFLISCKTPGTVFSKKTAHEAYGAKLESSGLKTTALGARWFEAGTDALTRTTSISLPYQENGYFSAERPSATGLSFNAKRGEQLVIELSRVPAANYLLFGDLFVIKDGVPKYSESIDTLTNLVRYNVKENTSFILRLQPELLQSGSYKLSIKTGPSLAFPAPSPNIKNKVISYWGAGRDGGERKHEGVDIGGARGTPLLAVGEGVVSSVTENNLGGKVVFIRSLSGNETWYYAHLDSQIATNGQRVKAGDVIGLMGNTGNARTTAPHLHFGIYTFGGAVDPLPYINPVKNEPKPIIAATNMLGKQMRVSNKGAQWFRSPDQTNGEKATSHTPVVITAATGNLYRTTLPNGDSRFISAASLDVIEKRVEQVTVKNEQPLLDAPQALAPVIKTIGAGTGVEVLGNFGGYRYVNAENTKGWIQQ